MSATKKEFLCKTFWSSLPFVEAEKVKELFCIAKKYLSQREEEERELIELQLPEF
jgi:hypothetical protein